MLIKKYDPLPPLLQITIYALFVLLLVLPMPDGKPLFPLVAQVGAGAVLFLVVFVLVPGIFALASRQEAAVLRWGECTEVVREPGLHWRFPMGLRLLTVSTAQYSMDVPPVAAVDERGTQVLLRAVVTYHVADAQKAVFGVADIQAYLADHAMAVLRRVAAVAPYELPQPPRPCLRDTSITVSCILVDELGAAVQVAGVEIDSVVWSCQAAEPVQKEAT